MLATTSFSANLICDSQLSTVLITFPAPFSSKADKLDVGSIEAFFSILSSNVALLCFA